jgi:Uri superfamily endonuclease
MRAKQQQDPAPGGGAYCLHLRIRENLTLRVGALGRISLPPGNYVYIGSARRSLTSRIARHHRLADSKTGKKHWHIDYVLTHPEVELLRATKYAGSLECDIARQFASEAGASAPIPRFGATDCRSGCKAHFFRIR